MLDAAIGWSSSPSGDSSRSACRLRARRVGHSIACVGCPVTSRGSAADAVDTHSRRHHTAPPPQHGQGTQSTHAHGGQATTEAGEATYQGAAQAAASRRAQSRSKLPQALHCVAHGRPWEATKKPQELQTTQLHKSQPNHPCYTHTTRRAPPCTCLVLDANPRTFTAWRLSTLGSAPTAGGTGTGTGAGALAVALSRSSRKGQAPNELVRGWAGTTATRTPNRRELHVAFQSPVVAVICNRMTSTSHSRVKQARARARDHTGQPTIRGFIFLHHRAVLPARRRPVADVARTWAGRTRQVASMWGRDGAARAWWTVYGRGSHDVPDVPQPKGSSDTSLARAIQSQHINHRANEKRDQHSRGRERHGDDRGRRKPHARVLPAATLAHSMSVP